MVQFKKARDIVLVLAIFVGVFVSGEVPAPTQTSEDAARAAAVAENTAVTLEERQAALRQLQEAARLYLLAKDSAAAAKVLNRVARLQLRLNDPPAAIQSHNQALEVLKQSSANPATVDNLNGLAAAHLRLDHGAEAKKFVMRGLELSRRLQYTRGEAEALQILSDEQNQHDHAIALQTAQQALKLWNTLGDKSSIAATHSQIGQYCMAQNLLEEATKNYQTALRLSEELQDNSGQARSLIALGFIEYRKGSWQDSIDYHTRAQELVDEKAEPQRMGQVAVGLAEAFNESGLPERGLVHFRRAQEYYRQTQAPALIAYAMWGLGRTYYFLGDYAEAANQFKLALASVSVDGLQAAQCHEHLGRVLIATREYPTALKHLQSALAIYQGSSNPKEAAQVLGLMGEIYQQQGNIPLAREKYQQSLQTFVRLSDRLNQAAIYYALGRLELQQDNLEQAENYLRKSLEVTEDIRRVSTSSDLTAAFSATVHDRYASFIECLMRRRRGQPNPDLDVQAFETSELARARSLGEMLSSTGTGFAPGVDPELVAQEKSLRQSLRVKEDFKVQLLAGDYKREDLAALENELARVEKQYQEISATLRARYPSFENLTRPRGWKLKEIQDVVVADDQTLLLEYSLGTERSYVWAVTRHALTAYELPPEKTINEAARKVYELLSAPPDAIAANSLSHDARGLSELILAPVASQLNNKQRIIVVADGALNYIPFQFLPSPAAGRTELVAGYEVVNAPSASILGQLRQETSRRQPAANVLAAFGDPVFQSNYAQQKDRRTEQIAAQTRAERWLPAYRDIDPAADLFNPSLIEPLFYARLELANLREVAGSKTLMATRFDATPEKLRTTDLTKYAILHLATHGILDPKRPERSGLILSTVNSDGQIQDGFLGLRDIYGLRAPVDLVVLSACRTGLGKDVRGEGLIGLTRGFIYAGASSVVASLWKVDDEATAELMKRFYANMLQGGMRPAQALRAAQNSIRQEPQWRAPFYWAAFTLQGDYSQVIQTPNASRAAGYEKTIAWAGGFLLLAAAAWWYFRPSRAGYSTVKK